MGRKIGKITVEEIKLEGGIIVDVWLDKASGTFHAQYDEVFKGDNIEHYGGKSWKNKDLEALRQEVCDWYKEKIQLKWEPVIVIRPNRPDHHGGKTVLGGSFERLMRAKKIKGDEYEWRTWAYQKPGNGAFVYDKDLEVYPPGGNEGKPIAFRSDEDPPVVIPFTPERWLSLLKIVEMETALREKLREIMNAGEEKIDSFLGRVRSAGLLAFAPRETKYP